MRANFVPSHAICCFIGIFAANACRLFPLNWLGRPSKCNDLAEIGVLDDLFRVLQYCPGGVAIENNIGWRPFANGQNLGSIGDRGGPKNTQ